MYIRIGGSKYNKELVYISACTHTHLHNNGIVYKGSKKVNGMFRDIEIQPIDM